jgi:hypothetical protein
LGVLLAAPLGAWGQAPPMHGFMAGECDGGCGEIVGPEGCYDGGCYGGGYCDGGCYGGGCYGDAYGHGGGMPHHGFTGPMPMGYGGTQPPIGYDLMNDVGVEGYLIDQRGPHYWDVRAEAVYLTREETFGRDLIFTKEGVAPTGVVRLTADDLEYGEEPGFRIMGRCDVCPLAVIEFGYMGIFTFDDAATAVDETGDSDLFSIFSNFGDNNEFPGVTNPGGQGPFTERAEQHSISIESDLQIAEISYRRYWLGWSPRISGTLLFGFRYAKLNEEFEFNSLGSETVPFNNPAAPIAAATYTVDADNDLSGAQLGADMWVGLMQGLRLGGEAKAGLYANRYNVTSEIVTTPPPPTGQVINPSLFEEFDDVEPALIADASVDLVADILPSVSLRAGCEVLFFNSVALAGDNFNTGSPYNPAPGDNTFGGVRTPFVDDEGEALYYGGHAGIEVIW